MVVDSGLVLTNAHVVAGTDGIEVDGRAGAVVGFDSNRDLAAVSVAGLDRQPVDVAAATEAGDVGTLVAIDATARTVRHPFEVRRTIRATGEDIYGVDGADRRALEVEVEFQQGWSGSGLFDDDAQLVGMAFAGSRRKPDVAYAIAESEIVGFLAELGAAARDGRRVDPGPCL